MTGPSMTSGRKAVRTASGKSNKKTLAQELSDILDVVLHHASISRVCTEHMRISLSLESGERLELELTGLTERSPVPMEYSRICLGHDFQTNEFYSIDDLDLSTSAKAAAQNLLKQFPNDVKFTSGKRSIKQQAAAMAPNVETNRQWIKQTYKDTPERTELQKWVDDHPKATTATAISAGLEGIMNSWSESQKRNISRHITGDAFDVQPVEGTQGDKIKQAIAKLPKLNWHTFEEGGLEIWHAQFDV